MRKLLFNLHLYLALIVGLFVVVVGVTGSIMAFEEEIDHALNPGLFKVEPKGERLTPTGMMAAAAKAFPGQKFNTVRLPQTPDETIAFNVKGKQTFLNPYTGEVIGSRDPKTWLSKTHQIHTNLLIGPNGKLVVVTITAVGLFLTFSGIYLWWAVRRWTIKWDANWRRKLFDMHSAIGIYSALSLTILCITGIVIHYDDEIEQALHARNGTQKVKKQAPSVVVSDAKPITPEQAIANALAYMPGTKELFIGMPPNPKGSYYVGLRYPEDLTPGGRSWVNVDQYSGAINNVQNSRTVAVGTRAIILNRATHTGDIFGVFTKLLFSISALMLVAQSITGYLLWWKKLQTAKKSQEPQAVETAA
jgi:uncharacterized iron-regulated membrane protein